MWQSSVAVGLGTSEIRRWKKKETTAQSIITPIHISVYRSYYALLLSFLSFFQRLISEVPRPIATELCHMLGSECNLRCEVRNLGPSPLEFGVHENSDPILDKFPTWRRITSERNKISFIGKMFEKYRQRWRRSEVVNALVAINEVILLRAWLMLGCVTVRVGKPPRHVSAKLHYTEKFTTNGQKFATAQHLDMSRCWSVALRYG